MSELSPQAQRIMQLTREAISPDAAAVDALRAALAAQLGQGHSPSAAHAEIDARDTTGIASRLLFKLAGTSLVVGALALGLSLIGARQPQRPTTAASPPPAAASSTARPPALGAERVDRSASSDAPAAPSAQSSLPLAVPSMRVPLGARPTTVAPRARASQRRGLVADRQQATAAPPQQPDATQAQDSLGAELALMRQARAALDRRAPQAALTLLDQHAQRYPHGVLQQECLAARALALCALGRNEAAQVAARELAKLAPGSPYLTGVRSGCGVGSVE